ncbi:MAG: hypothetical protein AVO39_07990 [delta proteobacterium MLS_D]|jgi:hypothetical protein|nr:MAG: hypothetical protein AVO39_07990 [delta proteobacterium MLS_D]
MDNTFSEYFRLRRRTDPAGFEAAESGTVSRLSMKAARYALLFLFLLAGCAGRPPVIADLAAYDQSAVDYICDYTDGFPESADFFSSSAALFLERRFAPWNSGTSECPSTEFFKRIASARGKTLYGENLRIHDPRWIETLITYMEPHRFPSHSIPALALHETDLRVFPTCRPAFDDVYRAGKGYPFDRWQMSTVFAGTPLMILHETSAGDWLYVRTPFADGWVRSRDVGTVGSNTRKRLTGENFVVPLRDRVPLNDDAGNFLFYARIGSIYSFASRVGESFRLEVAVSDGTGGTRLVKATVSRKDFSLFPLTMTPQAIARIADAMADDPYGWGGMYGNRDCSAFLRDLFAGFGLWLPRNSFQQINEGEWIVPLGHLAPDEKERLIIETALPFATILWMPGHVALYIGEREGRAMVLHVMWGVRRRTLLGEDRVIVGGCAVTTLRAGIEHPGVRPADLLVSRIEAMRILVPRERPAETDLQEESTRDNVSRSF